MALLEATGLDWRATFTAVIFLITIASAVYAWQIPQGRRFGWLSLLGSVLIAAGLWAPELLWRIILLDAAALVFAVLVWSQDRQAGRLFLAAVIAGSVLAAAGMVLGGFFTGSSVQPGSPAGKAALALLLLGFALKLAILPFSFWLAPVAERSTPMTAVQVISLLDIAEFGELASLRVEFPWLFDSIQALWIVLALLCMFGGALLALAQTNLRRMLAFSTIDDMGYLLLGLVAGSATGLLGALIGALSHSICKFLLFGAVGVAEHDLKRPLTLADCGLATRRPLAAAAFIIGSLGMIGVPPFIGFLGRWRLYLVGLELGGLALVVAMAVATALALLYYIRAIHQVWFGESDGSPQTETGAFRWIRITFLVGMALLVLFCFIPALLPGLLGR